MKRLLLAIPALFLVCQLWAQPTVANIKNIAFFLQDGVEILDFAGPMEVFISADFNVYTVAETKEPIKAMGALTIVPDYSLEDCPKPDMIAFFGGGAAARVSQKTEVRDWVNRTIPSTTVQFSVCTGAYFLGEAGLLDGRTATTFHSAIPYLQERFPKARIRDDVRFVDNGTVITTAGISAGIDGALHLVAKLKGRQRAVQIANNMEYFGWEPEKGLVMESALLQEIRAKGLRTALAKADPDAVLFTGELINLGNELATNGANEKAVEVFEYTLAGAQLTESDCEAIRKVYILAGKASPPSLESVVALIKGENYTEAAQLIQKAHQDFPNWVFFPEHKLNVYGYQLLGKNETAKAIEIFKLNVQLYPTSFNTYDSLGEAYMAAEDWEPAIKNYQKSLDLNPKNDNGRKMLEQIAQLKENGRRMER